MMRVNAVRAGVEGTVIAGKLLEKSDEESLGGRLGYNAATDVFEDLVAVGVIDPVKVTLPVRACFGLAHTITSVTEIVKQLPGELLSLEYSAP